MINFLTGYDKSYVVQQQVVNDYEVINEGQSVMSKIINVGY